MGEEAAMIYEQLTPVPGFRSVRNDDGSIVLSWDPVPGAVAYTVEDDGSRLIVRLRRVSPWRFRTGRRRR